MQSLTYDIEGTAKLIVHMLSVDPKWINPLPTDIPVIVPNTSGVTVTVIEANHCWFITCFLYLRLTSPKALDRPCFSLKEGRQLMRVIAHINRPTLARRESSDTFIAEILERRLNTCFTLQSRTRG